jgi:hypothetical protein
MRLVYKVSEDDWAEAYRLFVVNEKPTRRMSRRIMPWMGGLMILLSIIILASDKEAFGALPFGLMGIYFVYCSFALRRFFRKLYKKNRELQHEITADVSEESVHVITSLSDTHLQWKAIIRFVESDKIFMFFYSEWTFSIVPKRAFTADDIGPFRELLRRKILTTT